MSETKNQTKKTLKEAEKEKIKNFKQKIKTASKAGISSYLDQSEMGVYSYQLTAIYEDCESDFALTPTGEDQIAIEVTGIEENTPSKIIKVLSIYNMKGQRVEANDMSELPQGIYIIHGITEEGRLVCEKKIL